MALGEDHQQKRYQSDQKTGDEQGGQRKGERANADERQSQRIKAIKKQALKGDEKGILQKLHQAAGKDLPAFERPVRASHLQLHNLFAEGGSFLFNQRDDKKKETSRGEITDKASGAR